MARNEVDLSVVVPTLNSATTLEWTLLSLKSQIGATLEVVVADGYSTDETRAICARYHAPVISVAAGNMYSAINAGMRETRGDWVTYLNSDDYVYPDSFGRLLSLGRDARADLVYGGCDYVDSRGRHMHTFPPARPALLRGMLRAGVCPLPQQGTIFRRSVYDRIGGFPETTRFSSDYAFFHAAAERGFTFARLRPPSVAAFRIHPKQLSNAMSRSAHDEAMRHIAGRPIGEAVVGALFVAAWKAGNLPAYAERVLRAYHLSGRPRLLRAIRPLS